MAFMDAAAAAAAAASPTAVLVCQGRAAADRRIAVDRFSDPVAWTLLREGERTPVEQVRRGVAPEDVPQRHEYELVSATAEAIAPRTVAIDDALRARLVPQLVILGAGLDGRAWRMPELAEVRVFELDQPAAQQDKRDRLGRMPPLARSVAQVPMDFGRDQLDTALATAGHSTSQPTTWIWEGVVPYLTPDEVSTTVAQLSACCAPGSRLIVDYQQPSVTAARGRPAIQSLSDLAGAGDPLAGEPRRSSWAPEALRSLLAGHGFTVVSDEDLLSIAEQLSIPMQHHPWAREDRVLVADLG
jgi:methyltransferase (TIGR00027 family)